MTRDEILNMPAGREMDALIAENVMEWKRLAECGALHPGDTCNSEQIPHFSTDDGVALLVSKKMHEKGFDVYLELTHNPGAWAMFVKEESDSMFDFCAEAETIALAICRAALLTVMEVE